MYEVEYKIELTKEEQLTLIKLLEEKHFKSFPLIIQNDYYIEYNESPLGGYNLKRYRDEGDAIFYTEKTWEDLDGVKARKEIEKEVSREEFESEIQKYPSAITFKKQRQKCEGEWKNILVHVDMDTVKFDHSPAERFFVEAEVIVSNPEEVKASKEFVKDFLREHLPGSDLKESPGMFMMAFKKL